MVIEVDWLVEGCVLLMKHSAHVTREDIAEMDRLGLMYFDSTDAPLVHVLMDSSAVLSDPGLRAYAGMRAPKHPRCGWIIEFGISNLGIRVLSTIVSQTLRVRYRQASSFDEAVATLVQFAPELRNELVRYKE